MPALTIIINPICQSAGDIRWNYRDISPSIIISRHILDYFLNPCTFLLQDLRCYLTYHWSDKAQLYDLTSRIRLATTFSLKFRNVSTVRSITTCFSFLILLFPHWTKRVQHIKNHKKLRFLIF